MSNDSGTPVTPGMESARGYGGDEQHLTENPELEERDPDAPEPGHLGNDLSKMTLLETDLEALAADHEHEDNPEVQQALHDLHELTDELGLPESLDDN